MHHEPFQINVLIETYLIPFRNFQSMLKAYKIKTLPMFEYIGCNQFHLPHICALCHQSTCNVFLRQDIIRKCYEGKPIEPLVDKTMSHQSVDIGLDGYQFGLLSISIFFAFMYLRSKHMKNTLKKDIQLRPI